MRNSFAVHLSHKTDVAFRLLILLGVDADQTVSVGEAADRLQVSSHHLSKIAQELAHVGVVDTVRGRSGGVRLTPEGLATRVGDVVRALEPLNLVECFDADRNTCRLTPSCTLAGVLEAAVEAFLSSLDEYVVSDLCAKPTQIRRLLRQSPDKARAAAR